MASRIEELTDEIEEFIGNCKFQKFSGEENIVVNKGYIEELLAELRKNIPNEVRQSQKLMKQRESILLDAKSKEQEMTRQAKIEAEKLIRQAQERVNQLTNDTEIMEQAIEQADRTVTIAGEEAVKIRNQAIIEANEMKAGAIQYVDSLLQGVENIIEQTLREATSQYNSLESSLGNYKEIIGNNRMELMPVDNYLDGINGEDEETILR